MNVEKLPGQDADPNLINGRNRTPLRLAAANGDVKIMTALINAGANVFDNLDLDAGMYTPLQLAVANGHLSATKLLYRHGANVDQPSTCILNALLLAVEEHDQVSVKWLLAMGASMQCISEHTQQTLFDVAIDGNHLDMMQLLARQGCFHT